jgi:4-amino-4-deoxy-L-arabinose transferase-like glycosyltransferase
MDIPVRDKTRPFWALGSTSRWPGTLFGGGELTGTQFRVICAAILVVAVLARLPTLSGRSLWLDEAYSAWFSTVPLRELWTQVPLYETHPPFYYTLLKGWRAIAGSSEAGLRSLSVLASVGTVVLMATAARIARLGPMAERVGLLAALFLALNSGSVQFAQQARPYAIQTLAASLAVFCSFMLLARSRDGARPWRWVAGLAVSAGLTLWLHVTGVFIALGIWVGLAFAIMLQPRERRREQLLLAAVAGLGALLIWLPFLPTFLHQNASMAKVLYWIKFDISSVPGAWVNPAGGKRLKGPLVILGAAGIYWLWQRRKDLACHLLLVLTVAPLAMAGYSYFVKPIFLARLFEWLGPLLMALLALGVFALRPALRMPAAAVVCALSLWSTINFYGRTIETWREMLAQMAAGIRQGDLIIAVPNEIQLPVRYYLDPLDVPADIVYLPAPFPAPGLARTYVGNLGAPAVDATDVARLRTMLPRYRRVWLIERLPDLYDYDRQVWTAISKRFRPLQTINGSGGTITLFEER